jgi:hypothetical protein
MGLVLTLSQIAMQESLVNAIESDLRAVVTTASQPASKNKKAKTKSYGIVLPLDPTLGTTKLPATGHPSRISSMFRVK